MSKNKPSFKPPAKNSHVISASYSGPLPPPNIIDGYEALVAGTAAMIFKTYEQEVTHRQSCEKEMVAIESRARASESGSIAKGQLFGFIICMAFLGCGTYLIATGHEISGALFGGGSMAAIVTAFLATRPKK